MTKAVRGMERIPVNGAFDFWSLGGEFLKIAKESFKIEPRNFPGYMCVAQSIELFLKAYLLTAGVSFAVLKTRVRHDLTKALDMAERADLTKVCEIKNMDRDRLGKLSIHHKNRDFGYRWQGEFTLVPSGWAVEFAERLSKSCKNTRKLIPPSQEQIVVGRFGRMTVVPNANG